MWKITIRHEGLNKVRRITGKDKSLVEEKAARQRVEWDNQWKKKQESESKEANKIKNLEIAKERTNSIQREIESIQNILKNSINKEFLNPWDKLKNKRTFRKTKPGPEPEANDPSPPPDREDSIYQPKFTLLDKISKQRKAHKLEEIEKRYKKNYIAWEKRIENAKLKHKEKVKKYKAKMQIWEEEGKDFSKKEASKIAKYTAREKKYYDGNLEELYTFVELVLSSSLYPEMFPKEYELEYFADTNTLGMNYLLPDLESIPKIKEIKFIQTRNELKDTMLSEAFRKKLYDDAIYQTSIRVMHEVFESDLADKIDALVFNGWVTTINKGTGEEGNVCILSIMAKKDEFKKINLQNIDAKECFKTLKGVGSSKLHSITSIAPIMSFYKEDKRFVDGKDIAHSVDDSINLAAMDWEDFEHLVRELFEQEFVHHGGEVKITQASRDRGVDAIAFDPDPIRGGKIVIQAKRYTNTVDVAAVRDLFGTVMNEGATKGILVTTSNYGPDAYEFAKGKPLTLLNGSNLLHLLEKHGTKARIDLAEAKTILKMEKEH